VLDASAPIVVGGGVGKLGLSNENVATSAANRGNQITVKFKNVYSIGLNDLGKKLAAPAIDPDCKDPKKTCIFDDKPRGG